MRPATAKEIAEFNTKLESLNNSNGKRGYSNRKISKAINKIR